MGGGPSAEQKAAAAQQAALSQKQAGAFDRAQAFAEAQQNKVNPFFSRMMEHGLPYFSTATDAAGGTTARAFQPARARLEARLGQSANALPSGFAEGARTDLSAEQGRGFDEMLQSILGQNFEAKKAGAAGLLGQQQLANPLGYAGGAGRGYESVMNAPLAKPGLAGLFGGIAGSFLNPFGASLFRPKPAPAPA